MKTTAPTGAPTIVDDNEVVIRNDRKNQSPTDFAWALPCSFKGENGFVCEVYDPRIPPKLVQASADYEINLKLSGTTRIVKVADARVRFGENQFVRCGMIVRQIASRPKAFAPSDEETPLRLLQGLALYIRELDESSMPSPSPREKRHGFLMPPVMFCDVNTRQVQVSGTNFAYLAGLVGEEGWQEMGMRPDAITSAFRNHDRVATPVVDLDIRDDMAAACMSVLCLVADDAQSSPYDIAGKNASPDAPGVANAMARAETLRDMDSGTWINWVQNRAKLITNETARSIILNQLSIDPRKRLETADQFFCVCFSKSLPIGATPSSFGANSTIPQRLVPFRNRARKGNSREYPLLITGPTGSGKTTLARKVHDYIHFGNTDKRFVPINCGAIQSGLLLSELFGHVEGAFTGATAKKTGFIEQAGDGTVFMDEIDSLPTDQQVMLFNLLDNGIYYPLGSGNEPSLEKTCQCGFIFGTNRNIGELVRLGKMRQDFFSRIDMCRIELLPLCKRPDELRNALRNYWRELSGDAQPELGSARICEDAWRVFEGAQYPTNFRGVKSCMSKAVDVLLDTKRPLLSADEAMRIVAESEGGLAPAAADPAAKTPFAKLIKQLAKVINENPEIGREDAAVKIGMPKRGAASWISRNVINDLGSDRIREALDDTEYQHLKEWCKPRRKKTPTRS